MKKFISNEKNDNGYMPIFINPAAVSMVEMCASALLTKIKMVNGDEIIVRHKIDDVAVRLCPGSRG